MAGGGDNGVPWWLWVGKPRAVHGAAVARARPSRLPAAGWVRPIPWHVFWGRLVALGLVWNCSTSRV